MFNYGEIRGVLRAGADFTQDITPLTYNNPETHLVDWKKMADDEEAPAAIRLIAGRMQQLVDNPDNVEPIDKERVEQIGVAVWEAAREIGSPVTYSFYKSYETALGKVRVNGFSDMADSEGTYCPDETKPGQFLTVNTPGFRYGRQVMEGSMVEFFQEEIDGNNLPELTEEEIKAHPYVVLTAEQGMPHRGEDEGEEVAFDEHGQPAEMHYRTDGYTVISANVSGAVSVGTQSWWDTREEAQAWADHMYQMNLAQARQDTAMTSERQKQVLDALDAAIVVTENEAALGSAVDEIFKGLDE